MNFSLIFLDEGGDKLTNRTGHLAKDHGESVNRDNSDHTKSALKPNDDGRYVCSICEKTFKTV